MASTELREAAQQALEALELVTDLTNHDDEIYDAITALRAALAEPTTEDSSAVETVQERNFCPRCGKRTNDIHTCTPPHEERFCDTHCTWADHAPGCVRAEPVQEPVRGSEMRRCPRCWEPMFPPQRKTLTVTELQEALVYTNLIDRDAIEDPEGYDEGSTMAQIDELHRAIERAHRIGGQP